MPNTSDSLIVRATFADCRSALVGMQPQLRHVPPRASFSISVTSAPRRAARIAAGYPPTPPPMMVIRVLSAMNGLLYRIFSSYPAKGRPVSPLEGDSLCMSSQDQDRFLDEGFQCLH